MRLFKRGREMPDVDEMEKGSRDVEGLINALNVGISGGESVE